MSFNRPNFTGTNRSFFFASSKSDIAAPMLNVSQSDKFSSTTTGQTIVTFETSRPVSWNDARDLVGHGAVVTMCKAPIQEMDGVMFGLMVDALRKSTKWVNTPGVRANRTFFNYSSTGSAVASAIPPVPAAGPQVVHTAKAEKREKSSTPKKAEKREREVIVISDDEDDKYVARIEMLSPSFPAVDGQNAARLRPRPPAPALPETQPTPALELPLPDTQIEDSQNAWL